MGHSIDTIASCMATHIVCRHLFTTFLTKVTHYCATVYVLYLFLFQMNKDYNSKCNVNWLTKMVRNLSCLIINNSSLRQPTMICCTVTTPTMMNHTATMISHTVTISVITAICLITVCAAITIILCCLMLIIYRRKRKR